MITTEQRKHVDSSILTYLPPDLRLGPWHEGCMVQGLWHMTGAKALIENGEAKKRKPLHRQKNHVRVDPHEAGRETRRLLSLLRGASHSSLAGKLQKSCQHGDAKARLWP